MDIKLEGFNRREVLQYLRWQGSRIPSEIDTLIDNCMEETLRLATPRVIWRILPLDRSRRTPSLAFAGDDVRLLLTDCERVVLLAATLGNALEAAIRRAQVRDLSRALVLDCCGSAAIETVCDQAESALAAELGVPRGFLTDRFSPGYGDLPLQVQPELLTLVNAGRRIGLAVTDTLILTPRKSVTALIGVADRPQGRRFRGCAYCSMFETCAYRKAGKTCGRQ